MHISIANQSDQCFESAPFWRSEVEGLRKGRGRRSVFSCKLRGDLGCLPLGGFDFGLGLGDCSQSLVAFCGSCLNCFFGIRELRVVGVECGVELSQMCFNLGLLFG